MFARKKLTVADLTYEDVAGLLKSDQKRRNTRKVGAIAWPLLFVYVRHLRKKQLEELKEYKRFQ